MHQLETIALGLDELEAMRLCDLEGHDQEAAGERMGVSRGTVQRLLQSARAKVVKALLESAALVIEGKGEGEREAAPATTTDGGHG
jgi:predicted DNA-binding protein (UPF0251 family)